MLETHEREAIVSYYAEMDSSFAHWGSPAAYEMHYGYKERAGDDHYGSLARMDDVVAALAGVGPGEAVLDAGCGVGATALRLAAERGATVHGISLSPLQVAKAKRVAAERGLSQRACFSVQDYTATELPDGAFDVVWAMESLCHAPRKQEFLREAHRLLRAGGRLVVADYFLARDPLRADESEALRTWADGWVMRAPPALADFERMAAAAGFPALRLHDLTDVIRADADEMHRRGLEGLADDVRTASPRRLAHVRACIAQKRALDRGLWRYLVLVGRA